MVSPSVSEPPSASAEEVVERVVHALPDSGFFQGKTWRVTPEPFPLSPGTVEAIERLGVVLHRFQRTCNLIYRRSVLGSLPAWIRNYLDAGKPAELVRYGLAASPMEAVPRVIRPDLILRKGSFAITEIDSVPGGIGLTAWLNRTYAELGWDVIGGAEGMLEGMRAILPDGADVVISEESKDYRPEMEWLAEMLGEGWNVEDAERYRVGSRTIYRFFELFDLENVPFASSLVEAQDAGPPMTAPMKAFLEEKLWLALFWMKPLREIWRRELRSSNFEFLRERIPESWVVDPAPVPHHAVIPGLDIQDFRELAQFSQKERDLVLKISGFSERAWGSRGVHVGADLSQREWAEAVNEAVDTFSIQPYVLQTFRKGRRVEHPFRDESGRMETMKGRVRLCPYYFAMAGGKVRLGGVLASICPADKKILHGMQDAIMAPCVMSDDGY